MAEFQHHFNFKTRGNTTPQGKMKVYFCCHPDDFDCTFEEISNEILAITNCSIWYPKNQNILHNEDFLNELSQMQLLVMPITSRLMYSNNDALDVDFRFAIEKHIPVIPIMLESGLEPVFNKKCGSLHFLDKNVYDVTAIPYEKKLEALISAVLLGDEFSNTSFSLRASNKI
jgi:hypothetical protein